MIYLAAPQPTEPSCQDIENWARLLHYGDYVRGLQPTDNVGEDNVGSTPDWTRLPVPPMVFVGGDQPAKVNAALGVLLALYRSPGAVLACPRQVTSYWPGLTYAISRARLINALRLNDRQLTAQNREDLAKVVALVLDDKVPWPAEPDSSTRHHLKRASQHPASKEALVVEKVIGYVASWENGAIDQVAWIPLWRWAIGGPSEKAAIGLRAAAMDALGHILRRGRLTSRQVIQASNLADVIRNTVESRAVSVTDLQQRNLLLAAATRLWAVMQKALADAVNAEAARAALPPGAQPPATRPGGKPPAAPWYESTTFLVAAAATVLVGAVGFGLYRRQRG